jgi:hypothetical protein
VKKKERLIAGLLIAIIVTLVASLFVLRETVKNKQHRMMSITSSSDYRWYVESRAALGSKLTEKADNELKHLTAIKLFTGGAKLEDIGLTLNMDNQQMVESLRRHIQTCSE